MGVYGRASSKARQLIIGCIPATDSKRFAAEWLTKARKINLCTNLEEMRASRMELPHSRDRRSFH